MERIMMEQIHWICCPNCGNKTRDRLREDTVIRNYLLAGIAWSNQTVYRKIWQGTNLGKTGNPLELLLLKDAGEAIINYLKNARPKLVRIMCLWDRFHLIRIKFDKQYDEILKTACEGNPLPEPAVKKRSRQKKGKVLKSICRLENYKVSVCLFIKNPCVSFDNNQVLRMIKVKTKVSGNQCFHHNPRSLKRQLRYHQMVLNSYPFGKKSPCCCRLCSSGVQWNKTKGGRDQLCGGNQIRKKMHWLYQLQPCLHFVCLRR